MGLATLDALLYEEIAAELRERRVRSVSLVPGDRVPAEVAVILTSPEESVRFSHPHVLSVVPGADRTALWAAVAMHLYPGTPEPEIVVGIDPGPRPGFAVLAGARSLAEGTLPTPEATAHLAADLRRRLPKHALRLRVGNGDPLARERILHALAPMHRVVELVNEEGTTPRGQRRPSDAIAARRIARAQGRPIVGGAWNEISVTLGDITNLQRLSRERSGGQFTIPRSEAHRVLRGELTLTEALRRGEQRYHPPRPSVRPEAPGSERS